MSTSKPTTIIVAVAPLPAAPRLPPRDAAPARALLCRVAPLALAVALGGCVQGSARYLSGSANGHEAVMASQSQTIILEHNDRIERFRRLAALGGVTPPTIDQLAAPAGSVPGVPGPAPVVRVMFDERAFFDSDSAVPRPAAAPALDLIAENMRRDVPDAALTLLGHTDAVGTDESNMALSRRRAAAVMAALIERGVSPGQLSTVAIGKAQPIAPNLTADGRARNRRVEFMISGSEQANLAVVGSRSVNIAYFRVADQRPVASAPSQVAVFRPSRAPTSSSDAGFLSPQASLPLRPPTANPEPAAVWVSAPAEAATGAGSGWVSPPAEPH